MYTKFLSENLKGRDHLGDLCVDGKITLRWSLAHDSVQWQAFVNISNEPFGSIKSMECFS
jgi:hypothetical protein